MIFWKSPSSKIKIFKGVFGIVWIILNSKQWQKIKEKKTEHKYKKKSRSLPGPPTCSPPSAPPGASNWPSSCAGSPPVRPSPPGASPCRLPPRASRQRRDTATPPRAPPPPCSGHLLLRAGGSFSSLTPCLDDATLPRLPLALSLALSPPLSLSHTHGRRHRPSLPRPPVTPRLTDAPTSSALSLSSSSPSRPTPEALGRRKHRRSPHRPLKIVAVDLLPPVPPRAR